MKNHTLLLQDLVNNNKEYQSFFQSIEKERNNWGDINKEALKARLKELKDYFSDDILLQLNILTKVYERLLEQFKEQYQEINLHINSRFLKGVYHSLIKHYYKEELANNDFYSKINLFESHIFQNDSESNNRLTSILFELSVRISKDILEDMKKG